LEKGATQDRHVVSVSAAFAAEIKNHDLNQIVTIEVKQKRLTVNRSGAFTMT
jgi:hypothetical protein